VGGGEGGGVRVGGGEGGGGGGNRNGETFTDAKIGEGKGAFYSNS